MWILRLQAAVPGARTTDYDSVHDVRTTLACWPEVRSRSDPRAIPRLISPGSISRRPRAPSCVPALRAKAKTRDTSLEGLNLSRSLGLQTEAGQSCCRLPRLTLRQTFSIQSLEWVSRITYRNFLHGKTANFKFARRSLRPSIEAGTDEVKEKNFRAITVSKMCATSDLH